MFLLTQFLLVNAHFTLNLFTALACFAVTWLYYDAWTIKKSLGELTKTSGFLFLSLSFITHAATIDQSLLASPLLGTTAITLASNLFRLTGYLILILGQIIDPIQPLPSYRKKHAVSILPLSLLSLPFAPLGNVIFPVLAVITAILYLRRATIGLEDHLKPVSYAFFFLALSEISGLTPLFRNTSNVNLASLTKSFGPLWLAEHLLLAFFALILGIWVWSYLVKRLETQLFMIFTSSIVAIFLVTTIFFTATSLTHQSATASQSLTTTVQVLDFSINSLKAQVLSEAQLLSQSPLLIQALEANDPSELQELATDNLVTKNQAYLAITSNTGQIKALGHDPEHTGGSLSSDPLIVQALSGTSQAAIVTTPGVAAPQVFVRASSPVITDGAVIGVVYVGEVIDSAYLDGLKSSTGLDSSIYADNIRSATTFIAADGKSRWTGIREESPQVKQTVLESNQVFTGAVTILGTPYLASYAPLEDSSGEPVGMLFVGLPQIELVKSASSVIELTFLASVAMLILSLIPAFFVSRHLVDQLKH